MDFISLANMSSYIKVGDPKNTWQRKFNRPVNTGIQDDPAEASVGFGVSSINMKRQAGEALSAYQESVAFSDILRAACERKMDSQL